MDTASFLTFQARIRARLEGYSTKAERTAFLQGALFGALDVRADDRARWLRDTASSYGVSLEGDTPVERKPIARTSRRENPPTAVASLELLAALAALPRLTR